MRIERLDDVVVGPEAQARQLVHIFRKRGDHDDRRIPLPPDARQYVDAVELGQTNIEKNEIRSQHGKMRDRRFSIARPDGSVTIADEIGIQNLHDVGIVFDDENEPSVHAEPANLLI
ncbi:hypothetical protein D3C80_303140 [compost metagenome]